MCQNFLQLNKDKTEVIVFGNKDEVLKVNAYLDARGLTTENQVRNLGVSLESDLSFSSLVGAITKSSEEYSLFPMGLLNHYTHLGWILRY